MVIGEYFSALTKGLAKQYKAFDWRSAQSKLAFRATTACILSLYVSMLIDSNEPYWAAISAYVVFLSNNAHSLDKCIQRVLSTLAGAITAVIITHFLHETPLLLVMTLWIIILIAIYQFWMAPRYNYSWLLGGITLVLVAMSSWDASDGGTIISMAVARSLDICVGVVISYLIAIFMSKNTHGTIVKTLNNDLYQQTLQFLTNYTQSYKPISKTSLQDAYQALTKTTELLLVKIDLLYIGRQKRHNDGLIRGRCATTAMLIEYLHQIRPTLDLQHRETQNLVSMLCDEVKITMGFLFNRNSTLNIQSAYQNYLDNFKQHPPSSLQDNVSRYHINILQSMLCQLYKNLLTDTVSTSQPKAYHHKWHMQLRYSKHIIYGAMIYASVGIFFPAIWALYDSQGYIQIAISVLALSHIDIEGARFKGFLRIAGCIAGAVGSIFLMGMSTDNFFIMLTLTFMGAFVFLYIHYGDAKISYFGMQATLVFFIVIMHSSMPDTSIQPGLTRASGITLAIICLIIAQTLFLKISRLKKAEHTLKLSRLNVQIMLQYFPNKFTQKPHNLYNLGLMCAYKKAQTYAQSVQQASIEDVHEETYDLYMQSAKHFQESIQQLFILYCDINSADKLSPDVQNTWHELMRLLTGMYYQPEKLRLAMIDIQKGQRKIKALQSQLLSEGMPESIALQKIEIVYENFLFFLHWRDKLFKIN